jgi:hypothetical protein
MKLIDFFIIGSIFAGCLVVGVYATVAIQDFLWSRQYKKWKEKQ